MLSSYYFPTHGHLNIDLQRNVLTIMKQNSVTVDLLVQLYN